MKTFKYLFILAALGNKMVMKKALRQSIKEVGILVINGKPKKVARLPLEQKLPVAILHMVMVGDIGLMTESVISIIS